MIEDVPQMNSTKAFAQVKRRKQKPTIDNDESRKTTTTPSVATSPTDLDPWAASVVRVDHAHFFEVKLMPIRYITHSRRQGVQVAVGHVKNTWNNVCP